MESLINITILSASDFPYGGAPESFVRRMALGINFHNTNINVVRYWGDRYLTQNDINIECNNYLFDSPPRSNLIKILDLFIKIIYIPIFLLKEKFLKKTSILIVYGFDSALFLFPLIIFSKLFGIKCLRVITDYRVLEYSNEGWTSRPRIFFSRIQNKYFDRYYDGILVLSSFLYNYCINNGVKKKRIILIKHFIDLDVSKDLNRSNTIKIGFCGEPAIKNGIIDLVRSFDIIEKKYPESEFLIIGKMSMELIKFIKNNIKTLTNITFTGQLNANEVKTELGKCSILINPRPRSIWAEAGFPTKVGEYFATKKPVISTRVGDLAKELMDKREIVFAEPNSPQSLAEAVFYLVENPFEAKKIGINGYNWAITNLEYKQNAKKLLDFIYTII